MGWHPHCRCFVTNIFKTEEERREDLRRMLRGEPPIPAEQSKNYVAVVPDAFKGWCRLNAGRVERAKNLPYFIKDNRGYYDSAFNPKYGAVLGTKLGRTANKKAYKLYKDMPAPTLTKDVEANTNEIAKMLGLTNPVPMTFYEANEGRANINFGKEDIYKENCQISVVIHEARLRGLNVTSVGYNRNNGSVPYMLGERFQDIWINPKNGNVPTPTELRDKTFSGLISKLNSTTKSIGRYHIGINMIDGGHLITAERLANGKLLYYDAQCGTFLNIEEYSARNVEYLEIIKVDKLSIRKDWFKAIASQL